MSSPDMSPVKNVWHIMKSKTQQQRQWTVDKVIYQTTTGQNSNAFQPITSTISDLPFQSAAKSKADLTQW